jgi:trk system potassium uptake protein TrkA
MNKRFLVVGLGRFGDALARQLHQEGCEVVAVDLSMENVDRIKQDVSFAAQLDATDPVALRSIDAAACTAAIITMGEMFEASVLCVAALREVGVARILARVRGATHARILTAIGASQVVEVETEIGRRLARTLAVLDPERIDLSQDLFSTHD